MADKPRQIGEQIARHRAEEPLDMRLGLGRIGRADIVRDAEIGQHTGEVP